MLSVSKGVFHALAASNGMRSLASRYGLRTDRSFARRFVAGESVADAIAAARRIEAAGMTQTLDYLWESVATMAEADRATRAYLATINEIAAAGIGRNLSLKPTQLGLTVDRATCVDNLRRILDGAAAHDFFVRVEMEDSRYTQVTFDIFETLWQQGYRNAGIAVQSYLPRTLEDVRRMNALGARVRLVKGAYREPRRVAYQSKAQVDASFIEIMRVLLTERTSPAIATHDPAMIDATRAFARERTIPPEGYEFQMLYGVRRDLSGATVGRGLRDAGLRPLRPGVVPLRHAPPRRTAGKRGLRGAQPGARILRLTPPHPAFRLKAEATLSLLRLAGGRSRWSVGAHDEKASAL